MTPAGHLHLVAIVTGGHGVKLTGSGQHLMSQHSAATYFWVIGDP